jgi:SAM-dependent methyltransferase
LLRTAFDPLLSGRDREGSPVLDVGSADGPSSYWTARAARVVSVDPDPRGLARGGVCAALPDLPFHDETFAVVTAFDVIEHCADEAAVLAEVRRVLQPGGLFLMSVPAYQWAWTDFDVHNGHYRRYTRRRALEALVASGLTPIRSTYAFRTVFPAFAAQRLASRVRGAVRSERVSVPADVVSVPRLPGAVEKMLRLLCRADERALASGHDLRFGSSVLVAAVRSDSSES